MRKELKISEFELLRHELEATSKRIYDTAFLAITASSAILGYSLTQENIWVHLTPLLIIWGAFQIIRQSTRSQRRIVAYLQVFHEGVESGALWETSLAESRINIREEQTVRKGRNYTRRLSLAAQHQLLWILGLLSILTAWLNLDLSQLQDVSGVGFVTLIWLLLYVHMHRENRRLAGNGPVEKYFLHQFEEVRTRLCGSAAGGETDKRASDSQPS